jgi:hypothetical protein
LEQQPGSFQRGIWTGIVMARDTTSRDSDGIDPDEPAELDAVAGRLEAALDRIVRHLDNPRGGEVAGTTPARPPTEVIARLDRLIARLRDTLGNPAMGEPVQD